MAKSATFIKTACLSFLVALIPLLAVQPIVLAATSNNNGSGKFSQGNKYSPDTIEVKFDETIEMTVKGGDFASQTGKDVTNISKFMAKAGVVEKLSLVDDSAEKVRAQQKNLRSKGIVAADLASYFTIKLKNGQNTKVVAEGLKKLPGVVDAYPAPIAIKQPISSDMSFLQWYYEDAPNNMGITAASSMPGVFGKNVKIADLEYSWNTAHEDLENARKSGALWAVGTPVDPFADNNHGTAVAGIIGGSRNGIGVNGIASNAEFHMVNTFSSEYNLGIARAINKATSNMSAGDVILIEQQTYGADGSSFVPVEWVPSVYDAIKTATAAGIIVIEAAGNGSANLDDPAYGTSFPSGKVSSGAIIVGAGSQCSNSVPHYQLAFSTYGSRVDVQGPGECVTTTGYGYFAGTPGGNDTYTTGFNGTSSASAVVAATVAALSSSYESLYSKGANSTLIKNTLVSTGTPQDFIYNYGKIGPLPNLLAAIKSFDTTAPTTPTGVKSTLNINNKPVVTWNAATDNTFIKQYKIYRSGSLIATVGSVTKYTDTSARANTSYTYKVQAVDAVGSVSAKSVGATIKTR